MRHLQFFAALIFVMFVVSSSVTAQSKKGDLFNTEDYTSIAQVSGTAKGKTVTFEDPYTNHDNQFWAGTFNGTVNSQSVKFYCIDLQHLLAKNEDYWDEDQTSSEITYILNNYYPYNNSNYPSGSWSNEKEAAAVQIAIWHYSDGVDANTITDRGIKNRVKDIIDDTEANHENEPSLETLVLIPSTQILVEGNAATISVGAYDINGQGVPGVDVTLSADAGVIAPTTVTTDSDGHAGPITVTYSGTGTVTVTAEAEVLIPHGTRYVYKQDGDAKQKLVLATPSTDTKSVEATIQWISQPQGDCDLSGFTTYTQGGWGSPSNSGPGQIRDMYFDSVFPNGLVIGGNYTITLTSAEAVKNYLPDGGTADQINQNYVDPTSSINILAGQLAAATLNVEYDKSGYIGSNDTDLGDLMYAGGTFSGLTVNEVLAIANTALGGGSTSGYTYSELNDALTALNENFDNGTQDLGDLSCDQPCLNTIGDFVWHDSDVDGKQDDGPDSGIEGVVVQLIQNNAVVQTTTTNAAGYYEFTDVENGTYTVKIADSNFEAGAVLQNSAAGDYSTRWFATKKDNANDDEDSDGHLTEHTAEVTVDCNDDPDIDFGFFKVCVELEKSGPASVNLGETVTYEFTMTNCGDVLLSGGAHLYDPMLGIDGQYFQIPAGQQVTYSKEYTTIENDCGELENNAWVIGHPSLSGYNFNNITVRSDDSHTLTVNCNPDCSGEIGDYVFVDMTGDCNGDQTGSTPIQGAKVVISYNDGVNTVSDTTTTNAQGKYLFTGLCANEYSVKIISVPASYDEYTLSTDSSFTVTLATDDAQNLTADFGYCPPPVVCDGEIGDKVWLDYSSDGASTNCNGIQDDGEPGIQGVKVILKKDGQEVASVFTDDNGNYLFDGLCYDDGCYTVHIDETTLPGGSSSAPTYQGNDSALDSDSSGVEVCLDENNKSNLTIDFGFCSDGCGGCEEACLGDFIWFDSNENGIQDNGEVGVENVLVELYNQNGAKISSTTSDEDGFYRFNELIPGRYYVRFIAPSGYIFTSQNQGSDDEFDSDASANGSTELTLFVAGYCDLSWDAGLVTAPPSPSCLGDRVWFDANHNGIEDVDETGVENVTVKLIDANNSALLDTTVTDEYGNYKFDYLSAGAYKVMFVLPSGYEFTLQDQGNDDELDSDADNTGITGVINLGESECQLKWDAGLYAELPDLKLNKEVDNNDPQVGDQVTFTITITNEGSGTATGVEVTDYFPTEGLTYNSYSAAQGTFNVIGSEGIWTIGEIDAGESLVLELFFTVEDFDPGYDFDAFDLGVASDYNVFALCSVNFPSSDTECKVAVGWDAYMSYYSVGDKMNPSNGDEDALVVGRSLTFVSGAVFNGNVVYGTDTNLPQSNVTISGGSLIQDPNRIDFAAAGTYLKNLSAQLGGYTVNGTTTYQWGGLSLDGTDPFLNVFHVSGAELSESHTMTINVPNGSVVLVNIDGSDIVWTGGLMVNGTSINNVLYNFYEASMITIQGIDVRGSILAPCATVDFVTGVQNGQMIAKYLIGQGQYNCEPFLGNIPGRPNITNTAEITAVNEVDPDSAPNNGVTTEDDYAAATIYFGNDEDSGSSGSGNDDLGDWEPIGDFESSQIIWSISADNDGYILAGTAGGELYRMTDDSNWERLNEGMLIGFIWDIEVASNNDLYIGTEQGIFKSTNGGNTWQGPLNDLNHDIRALEIDDATGDIYAAAWGFGIFKLTNGSGDWEQVNNGLTNLIVNSITIDSEGRMFAGTFGGGIYMSTDGGDSWTTTSMEYNMVWTLAVTSTDEIYAATYGKGVYRSVDNGATWVPLNVGLVAEHVYSVAVNANDEVYVSTWTGGVYKLSSIVPTSAAGSGSSIRTESQVWTSVGMNGYGISALMIDKNSSMIYAGSSAGKMYKKLEDNSVTEVDEIIETPTEYKLSQNYPNPFNPSTTIEFGVSDAGNYKLRVYNAIGEQVAELVNGELTSGYHQVHFDASRLASGIYFYKLVGKNVNLTRKMILMK